MGIGITETEQKIIIDILNNYRKEYCFYFYGSRVKGTFEKTSDLDILIKGKKEMPLFLLEEIKEKFDASKLPYIVNFSDYYSIDKNFYNRIENDLFPYDWKEYKIQDLCSSITSGGTPKSTNSEYYNGGDIPWLNTKEVHFNRIYSTEKHITEVGLKNSAAKWIKQNNIIIAMYGATAGNIAINKIPLTTNQACCNLEINEKFADYRFVYYYLLNKYTVLSSMANGGAQQNLNSLQIKNFSIYLPPLPTQQKIAKVLSAIDDKIELNNKINKNLEQQAQAIFKSWFVDFEPFGGIMPNNWETTDIYSIANIIYGAPFASKGFNTIKQGKPIVRIRDLKTDQLCTYTDEVHPKGYLLKLGDIVVGMDGEFRPYLWGNDEAWLNQRVCVFENKNSSDKAFVYFTIKPLLNHVEQTEVATTVIHIGKNDFDKFNIYLPERGILDKFGKITTPMIERIVNNKLENKRLANLRDTLLPKLMSGEIDVEEVEV